MLNLDMKTKRILLAIIAFLSGFSMLGLASGITTMSVFGFTTLGFLLGIGLLWAGWVIWNRQI